MILLRSVIMLLVAFSTLTASSCIYEYREVTFYPNSTQNVGRDWIVVNYTNPFPFYIYDMVLRYREETIFIPNIAPGTSLKIDPYLTLSPENFPLNFNVSISRVGEAGSGVNTTVNITYTIHNLQTKTLDVNVSIPVFSGVKRCYGCRISENYILFEASIPSEGSSKFTLMVNGTEFEVPDGNVSFEIDDSIPVKYGSDIHIAVEKERKGNEWYATFHIQNPMDRDVNVTFEAWYTISSAKTVLFNRELHLKANENISLQASVISNSPPVFYIMAKARFPGMCKVTIQPAVKSGNSYIVGYGVLKGFRYVDEGEGEGKIGGGGGGRGESEESEERTEDMATAIPRPEPITILLNLPSFKVGEISIGEAKSYVAMMLPAAYGLFFAIVLFPIMSRRGMVVSSDLITPQNYALLMAYGRRIYSTPSNAIPGSIIVQPDESIVQNFVNLGLDKKDVECVAISLRININNLKQESR